MSILTQPSQDLTATITNNDQLEINKLRKKNKKLKKVREALDHKCGHLELIN